MTNITTIIPSTRQSLPPSLLATNVSCHPFGPLLVNTDVTEQTYLAVSVVAGILTISTIILNGLVFKALITLRQYRIATNFLLVMLTVVDLCAGVVCFPLYAAYMGYLAGGNLNCILGRTLMVSGYSTTILSTITIAFITCQLYFAILQPFKYHGRVNKFGYLPFLMACWIGTSVFVFVFVFIVPNYWTFFKLGTGSIFFSVYCILCFAHLRIYIGTRVISKTSNNFSAKRVLATNGKTLKMVTTVLFAFGVCYLPYIVFAVCIAIQGLTPYARSHYAPWIEIVAMSSSLLNPCIYCFRLKSIRRAVFDTFSCMKIKRRKNKRTFSFMKSSYGNQVNSVNLSILTTSFTSLSGISFNHEHKYKGHDTTNHHTALYKSLNTSQSSLSSRCGSTGDGSNNGGNKEILEDFYRQQAAVIKEARFLFIPS